MTICEWLRQDPVPGCRLLKFCGDTQTFILTLDRPRKGNAWLRTNIGSAEVIRREIIRAVDVSEAPLARDWFDRSMRRIDDLHFSIRLPLNQVGHFEAKTYFLESGADQPLWPPGSNTVLNVEPAETCCANIIYNAFVRQFGPNKSGNFSTPVPAETLEQLDHAGYAVIPPSGTFRNLIAELDFIVGTLGCRYLQLLPIHPTPTTYGRMGRFGSPYAALSFTAVDPALAEFDPKATPLEQFIELVDAAHARGARILIDIAINHTGWAASLHESHPRWLSRDDTGQIEVPGAWGVRWEDLTKLDYAHKDLWQYMADVFLTWCRRGVDGFRCDAGYMIPQSAWTYIIARVRDQFPDTIFLLEGLGGKLAVTRALLNRAGFDWAYSELFQNYDRSQIEHYLPGALEITEQEGLMVHYAETHDNPRLAARSSAWARMRTALCALASRQGAFGFANGVEWLATEKIDVHNASSLNWGATENQVDAIGRLNALLREHPAFGAEGVVSLGNGGAANTLLLLRAWRSSANKLLIAANLDDQRETAVTWNPTRTGVLGSEFTDLLTGQPVTATAEGDRYTLKLPPGKVMCLTGDGDELARMQSARERFLQLPSAALSQRLQAKALEVFRQLNGLVDLGDFNLREAAVQLQRDPKAFCRQLNPEGGEPGAIQWKWPQDERRVVMLPPGHFLLVLAPVPFRARIAKDNRTIGVEDGLPAADGGFFALFAPQAAPDRHLACLLKIRLFENQGTRRISAPLLYLCRPENLRLKQRFRRRELLEHRYLFLGTNGRGAMLRACVSWGELKSRYEGLLSVNPDRDVPEDRCMLLARCRAWVVYQGYSQAIDNDCLNAFHFDYRSLGRWRFTVPTGQGQSITLTVDVQMPSGENAVVLTFHRHFGEDNPRRLEDQQPVQLILRPDIENRSFHETTKAYQGPEHRWPAAIRSLADGFVFAPDNRPALEVRVERGSFTQEPEWHYMVHRSLEAERGLDPDSDLFSPGFLHIHLTGGQKVQLTARMVGDSAAADTLPAASGTAGAAPDGLSAALTAALHHYVVRRGELKSVIAGYPWFLDWGRDSLIVVRGMVAAGMLEDARKVLQLFGQFERNGTIPNMISGKNAANRDTSDAPLWFFKACEDMLDAEGNPDFLDTAWSGRTIRSILAGMGRALVDGTPNGIRMDPDTALLFSPAHFTWMDTNHPAGTPREGYPIEIQALWYRALRLLARIDIEEHRDRWEMLAGRVRSSILERFFNPQLGHFSDCLHAKAGVPAGAAQADDALRPNQLLVLTLGATDDPKIGRSVLDACEALLVPGAIRSLADRRVARPQPIVHQGRLLNDPYHPYWGIYTGDEDTRRKPAYHNGTAWTWLFPSYCEAWAQLYGAPGRITALGWLGSSLTLINQGCIGQVPEILDGDAPHLPRGCDAQAWGVSELLRVWLRLNSVESEPVPGDS